MNESKSTKPAPAHTPGPWHVNAHTNVMADGGLESYEAERTRAPAEGDAVPYPRFAELLRQEHALSDAYVRLRQIIGAMDPPTVTDAEALWAYVESVAREKLAGQPQPKGKATGKLAAVYGDKWEGAEEWMPLAWELCANECGEEACAELIWEGGPIPEPWGDRWLKYEDQAKEMIAMVRASLAVVQAPAVGEADAAPQAEREPLTKEQVFRALQAAAWPFPLPARNFDPLHFARAIERAHGIGEAQPPVQGSES